MTTAQDYRVIKKALREVPVSEGQWVMACPLYRCETGLDATLEFIYGLEPRGLLLHQQAPHWHQLSLFDETH